MRQLVLILGLVVAFGVPVSANAATTTEQVPFDTTFALCNGDLIHVSGQLAIFTSQTTTPSGGTVTAVHFQPQGVSGVDLSTGTVFRGTGLTRDLVVTSPAGPSTETFVNRFQMQATGGAESYIISELLHVTVTPDGTVRVFFDNFSAAC